MSVAGIGPVSMSTGSEPTTLIACTRATGVSPCARTAGSEATSSAAAPSEIWLETAAVMRPPSRRGLSSANFSFVLSRSGTLVGDHSGVRRDLVGEPSGVRSGERSAMTLECELLHGVAGDAPLLGDHLGAAELGDLLVSEALSPAVTAVREAHAFALAEQRGARDGHRAHHLDPARDHQVLGPGHHGLGGEVHGLLG